VAIPASQPLGPRSFDFHKLSDEHFELLCYFIVALDFPAAHRLRPPDGGADAALTDKNPLRYARCWQFKNFDTQIKWPACSESLERARKTYEMPHYTFCFARDLTMPQEKLFRKHLVAPHDEIKVDWWGASRLAGALVKSMEGQRIANYFYGPPEDNTALLVRTFLQTGGMLETGDDATERLHAVAEWLSNDPFFSYPIAVREPHIEAPTPNRHATAVMEVSNGRHVIRFEAIPRNPEASELFGPAGQILFESSTEGDEARATFERAISGRERVTIDRGVSIVFDRLPPFFEKLFGEHRFDSPTVVVGPRVISRPTWNARLLANTDLGTETIDAVFNGIDPPPGWEGESESFNSGLRLALRVRKTETGFQGQFNFGYTYSANYSLRSQLAVVSFLLALHGKGAFRIEERDSSRTLIDFDTDSRGAEWLPGFRTLLSNLVTIEDWCDVRLELPEELDASQVEGIAELAWIIRNKRSKMNFDQITLDIGDDPAGLLLGDDHGPIFTSVGFQADICGQFLTIGYLSGEISSWSWTPLEHDDHGRPSVIRIEPTDEESRHSVFRLTREQPTPGHAPEVPSLPPAS
jgi:hypothetical protein